MSFHQKPVTFVKDVTIRVADLEKSLQFYREVIGLNVLERKDGRADLTADGKTSILSLEEIENPVPKQRGRAGLYHFAILLPEKSDLASVVRHSAEKRIPIGSSDHLVSEALYLNDPDGNGIEIYIDRDPSEWTWNGDQVTMTVDPLDFEQLIAAGGEEAKSWNGLPEETIMGHIHLHVSDLQEAEKFYIEGLGFDVVNRFGAQALFISDGDYHHHIGLNTWAGVGVPATSPESPGLESYTIVLPDEETRKNTISRVEGLGAEVVQEEDAFVTEDPSGNRIRLVV
ncbi:VOC family protein [Salimicrobium halophilum]|uniref:Catechol 2,3-dioxygenase n=1 Tax=Salimicrobium halophilum TaxID=86666 RepID=A0A1G8UXN2_9BACI|nr:VOC family protein [Salimicrobium halophilum]SDJ57845.1 catechol 2,3-dioxygenase [Salimicrobium halophilum]